MRSGYRPAPVCPPGVMAAAIQKVSRAGNLKTSFHRGHGRQLLVRPLRDRLELTVGLKEAADVDEADAPCKVRDRRTGTHPKGLAHWVETVLARARFLHGTRRRDDWKIRARGFSGGGAAAFLFWCVSRERMGRRRGCHGPADLITSAVVRSRPAAANRSRSAVCGATGRAERR